MQQLAYKAYGEVTSRTANSGQIEYALFQDVTQALKNVDEVEMPAPAVWADAIDRNMKLWQILSTDLASDANELDPTLKRNLIALAESVRQISYHVLSRKAEIAELVEINEIIMQGLEGQSSTPANVAAE
jgi:flagellar biosynthesis activator protein FlaF